ncbi:MAG: FtsX-like permease family protein [Acidobacteria bacterium]|nr:FtsX-like permease family protein [Acidobacteriota bacterium]
MTTFNLVRRSLTHYWRTNLAMTLGVATAVAVLAGALLVGNSVRGSLRDLFLGRLGRASVVISASHYFPEDLSTRVESQPGFHDLFASVCPMIVTQGVVTHQESGRRAGEVRVYGVDERFWQFHQQPGSAPSGFSQRQALVSLRLAQEAGIQPGDSILLRLEVPSEIPAESLHGRKDSRGRTVRLNASQVVPTGGLGEFSLSAEQQSVSAIFVPLKRLQRELEQEEKVNYLLVSETVSRSVDFGGASGGVGPALQEIVNQAARLEDLGVRLRLLPAATAGTREKEAPGYLSLERTSTLLDEHLIAKAKQSGDRVGFEPMPILTYLANRIRSGGRVIPYSLVAAVELGILRTQMAADKRPEPNSAMPPVWLNSWAAEDLNAKAGDTVSLEYYVWQDEGRLLTRTVEFQLAAVLPIQGLAADRNLAPEYPGISDSDTLSDWDPPFPMDLGLVRPKDEAYWKQYRATPKAFVSLEEGQKLWQSRFGQLTSLRFIPRASSTGDLSRRAAALGASLRAELSPFDMGFVLLPVRTEGLAASRGATDFGEYFTYFSFFLVASALLLATLFFRLGIEQRLREAGLLKALGFAPSQIRNLFLSEGLLLACAGSVGGMLSALVCGYVLIYGLRTWWVGAVGTTDLSLHVSSRSLLTGGIAGVLSAAACIGWTLHRLMPASPRGLLSGSWTFGARQDQRTAPPRRFGVARSLRFSPWVAGVICLLMGGVLLLAAVAHKLGQAGGFFGAGALFLVSFLFFQSYYLQRTPPGILQGRGAWAVARLGFRSATDRPGRSLLCIALIAAAAFIIVAVEAFRREPLTSVQDRHSGSGGFALAGQSLLPVFYKWNTPEGLEALGFSGKEIELLGKATVARFRVRPGEDSSCLNLFQPRNPRIVAPAPEFLAEQRFAFQQSLASDDTERRNPWLLLNKGFPDGAIPVIGGANSLAYVLHLKLGEDWVLQREGLSPMRLRVVGALADSLFQRELLMSEENFKRLFPDQQGYRFFLFDLPPGQGAEVTELLETRLADYGLDVFSTADRLASFHRVENTYLSTFQALGGFGLLLGTLGLAVVLVRNLLERRRELALLRAVGYTQRHLAAMVLAENVFLLFWGIATGASCAVLAILPALSARGWALPVFSLAWLLLSVWLGGLSASLLATRAALRSPLLESLRTE